MHIHIHNDAKNLEKPITPELLLEAGIAGHQVTRGTSPAEFTAHKDAVEVLITPPWEVKTLDLYAAPKLKFIQSTSAGVDLMRPFSQIPPQVTLANNRGTHSDKAGEYALMAILMMVHHMPHFATAQRQNHWAHKSARLAHHHRLTIVGLGSLGGGAARQAKRLGLTITGVRNGTEPHPECDRVVSSAEIETVLPETDILLLAAPLTSLTANILSAARMAMLPSTAGVINIGRGGLLDQDALFAALNEDRLGGAILDVFNKEPLPDDSTAWSVKNLIITPHMSAADPALYNPKTLAIFKKNLDALAAGQKLPTAVDFEKGY